MFEAAKHDGTSVIEILQNCVIFNDGAHKEIADRTTAADKQLILKHGEPMIFGKDRNKGIRLGAKGLEVVTIGENNITEKDLLVHDMTQEDSGIHNMLVDMKLPHYPMAFGVIRSFRLLLMMNFWKIKLNRRKKILPSNVWTIC